jgi:hypothetical protein
MRDSYIILLTEWKFAHVSVTHQLTLLYKYRSKKIINSVFFTHNFHKNTNKHTHKHIHSHTHKHKKKKKKKNARTHTHTYTHAQAHRKGKRSLWLESRGATRFRSSGTASGGRYLWDMR